MTRRQQAPAPQPIQPSNAWVCFCQPDQPMNTGEFRQHLVDAHEVREHQGVRTLKFHIDATDFYQSEYEWDIQGVKAIQSITRPRHGWYG